MSHIEPRVTLPMNAERSSGGERLLARGTLEVLHCQMASTVVFEMCDRFEAESASQTLELLLVTGMTCF